MKDIREGIQEWIEAEERAGRKVDEKRLDQHVQLLMRRHNNTPRKDFNGLTPSEMSDMQYYPFSSACPVQINRLEKEQYDNAYATRVFRRLFYWMGITEKQRNKETCDLFEREYKATELLPMIFSFKK